MPGQIRSGWILLKSHLHADLACGQHMAYKLHKTVLFIYHNYSGIVTVPNWCTFPSHYWEKWLQTMTELFQCSSQAK